MASLDGKVALVTGGGSGMGRAICHRLAEGGAAVVIADVDEAAGERVRGEIAARSDRVVFQRTDVSVAGDVEAMVQAAVQRFGRLDMAFNNAGVDGPIMPLAEHTAETFQRLFSVNLLGVFLGMKHQIAAMLQTGGGAIVNTSSIAGLRGHPGIGLYSATKHGVGGLTKTAAIEYGHKGIRVNSLCPGGIETPMLADYLSRAPELKALIIDNNPMRRLGRAEEMARAAVWLASDDASYINGQQIAVDGGKICSDV